MFFQVQRGEEKNGEGYLRATAEAHVTQTKLNCKYLIMGIFEICGNCEKIMKSNVYGFVISLGAFTRDQKYENN